MARTKREVLENTRMRLLAYLVDRAEACPERGTSFALMARALSISEGRARSACRALQDEGFIIVRPVFDEDGGQRANRYIVTLSGCKVLKTWSTNLLKRYGVVGGDLKECGNVENQDVLEQVERYEVKVAAKGGGGSAKGEDGGIEST